MHIPSTNIWTLLKDALVHVINFKLNDLTEFLFQWKFLNVIKWLTQNQMKVTHKHKLITN